jgi:hypothetical protein
MPYQFEKTQFTNSPIPVKSRLYTADQAIAHIGGLDEFEGPGWYVGIVKIGEIMHEYHMLACPIDRDVNSPAEFWAGEFTKEERFWFHTYDKNPSQIFNNIVNAPIRYDERN